MVNSSSSKELLKEVGQFGIFQKRTVLSVCLISLLSAQMIVGCNVFVVYTPPHRCHIKAIDENKDLNFLHNNLPDIEAIDDSNHSHHEQALLLSRFIPIEESPQQTKRWSQCQLFDGNGSSIDNDLLGNKTILCDNGWRYFAKPGMISAVMEFDLVCGDAWLGPISSTVHLLGFMTGTFAGGFFSDRFGRRKVILSSWFILTISTCAIALLPSWPSTLVFWFLMGCCVLARSITGVVIINEQTPLKYRYICCTLNAVACAGCGVLIALVNFLVPNWRHFLLIFAAAQLIISIPTFCFIHESLTWLLQNHKIEDVKKLLRLIARVNKRNPDKAIAVVEKRKLSTEEKKEDSPSRRMNFVDLLRISFLRKRIIIMAVAWTAAVLNFQCLSIGTNSLGGNRYINAFFSALLEIPGLFLNYLGLKKIGGRKSFIILIGLSGGSLLLSLPLLKVNDTAVIVCNLSSKMFSAGALLTLYVFGGDFFPTLLRNQSYGVSSLPSRVFSLVGPFLLFIGEQSLKAIPYIVMGVVGVGASIGVLFLPETRNTPLPDTLEDARNQDKLSAGCFSCQTQDEDQSIEEEKIKFDVIEQEQTKEI